MEDFSTGASAPEGGGAPESSASSESNVSETGSSTETSSYESGTSYTTEAPTQEIETSVTQEIATESTPGTAPQFSTIEDALAHITQLNQQIEQHQPYAQLHTQLEEYGGWDTVQPLVGLASNLFAPLMGEEGQQAIDPRTGMLEYTSAPFVEQLAQMSPSTLFEVVARGLDMPYGANNESLGHAILREVLGVNPELLETYQQIQTLEQAQPFLASNSPVEAYELENVPAQYHDAYKSLDPDTREEILALSDGNRDKVLAIRDREMKLEHSQAEQTRLIEEQRSERMQAWHQDVARRGEDLVSQVRNTSIDGALKELESKANFFGTNEDNQVIWNEVVSSSANSVSNDPAAQLDIQRAEGLYKASAYNQAIGEQFKAQQLKVEADRIAKKLDNRFRNEVTKRTKWWSNKLGATRQQQPVQPRVEITNRGAGGGVNQGQPATQSDTPANGQRYQLSPARINELASQLALRNAGH